MVFDKKKPGNGDIRVADITVFQLSHGLYRSTACALKELVNNAFDANATEVRIDTNFPEFDFISCIDNGEGMKAAEFERYFTNEGIGACMKREGGNYETGKYNRPLIGKLGIGMMSMGQLCNSFEIESHYIENGEKGAFHAEIVLTDVGIPDEEEIVRTPDFKGKDVEIGKWVYEPIDFDEREKGFKVFSTDVKKTFRDEMKGGMELLAAEGKSEKMSFHLADLHKRFFNNSKSVRDCKPYLETIWELETLCPIPYAEGIDRYPINRKAFDRSSKREIEFSQALDFLKERQARLKAYNFRIIFDGIELRKYIQLPAVKGVIPRLYFFDFNDTVYMSKLKFAGYIFAQASQAIKPLELSGIQIRLKDVGIGAYDSTFLKFYEKIETIRNRWVSGEAFVDEGLEMALNLDRDSFNEHDEHYKTLQKEVHRKVHEVFIDIDSIGRAKKEEKNKEKQEILIEKLESVVATHTKKKFVIRSKPLGKENPPLRINESKKEIIINTDSTTIGKKNADNVYRFVQLAYEVAVRTTQPGEDVKPIFSDILKTILREVL